MITPGESVQRAAGRWRLIIIPAMVFALGGSAQAAAVHPAAAEGRRPAPVAGEQDAARKRPGAQERERYRARQRHGDLPRGLWSRMTDAEREKVFAFMEEHFPRMYLELERQKDRNPDHYDRRMQRVAPEMRHLMEMMETRPEHGALIIKERRLDMEMRQLAGRYRSAEDEDKRSQLRRRMHALCTQAFDARQRRREIQIRELEARITELHERHAQADRMREKLIEQEVKERLDRPMPRKRRGQRQRP